MMWSKLQKDLYNIIDKQSKFQMHCSVYKTKSAWNAGQKSGVSKKKEAIPRYWITVGQDKEIIWDFPNSFLDKESNTNLFTTKRDSNTIQDTYFIDTNYTWVPDVIRKYINTSREKLLTISFEEDKYGLVDILRKYDRRISTKIREEL